MNRSFQTTEWLYDEEKRLGRSDTLFKSKAWWKKDVKPINEGEVLAFDCDNVKGYKYKM